MIEVFSHIKTQTEQKNKEMDGMVFCVICDTLPWLWFGGTKISLLRVGDRLG